MNNEVSKYLVLYVVLQWLQPRHNYLLTSR